MTRLSNRRKLRSRSIQIFADLKTKLKSSVSTASDWSLDADGIESESRLQRRLSALKARSQRSRPVISRLKQRLVEKQARRRLWQRSAIAIAFGLGITGSMVTSLFVQEKITIGGVPYRVVNKFWQDPPARAAYFTADKRALHNRLKVLGIEEDIKNFYRDRFDTEYELDRHIHQIMFDRTGYVGEAYEVNEYGRLVSVQY